MIIIWYPFLANLFIAMRNLGYVYVILRMYYRPIFPVHIFYVPSGGFDEVKRMGQVYMQVNSS